jgi:5-methylcytosine-specific restriction endonuclease McrBC regulatory subunit McrC
MNEVFETIGGKSYTKAQIEVLAQDFERDWEDDEVTYEETDYGRMMRLLNELQIPTPQVEALERRASNENVAFPSYVSNKLRTALAYA